MSKKKHKERERHNVFLNFVHLTLKEKNVRGAASNESRLIRIAGIECQAHYIQFFKWLHVIDEEAEV